MAVKKSQIYSSLWASCNALRGGMDASIYKDYILVLLFVKYVSDKYGDDPYAPIVVPEGGSFGDMVTRTGIYMIDASKGFVKDGPKNRLRDQDVHKIVDCFTRELHVPGYAEMVPFDRVTAEGFTPS